MEPVPITFYQGSTLLVEVSIPLGEGLLSRVGRVHPGGPGLYPSQYETYKFSSDFYWRSIQCFCRIAAPLTLMLKISRSTESTTRPEKGRVGVGGDGGNDGSHDNGATSSNSSTDSSTSATQIAVENNRVDSGGGKWVEELSKSRKTSKAWKVAKAIGSEERLPKHRSSVGL